MRAIDLKPFELLNVPRSQGELMRALNRLTLQLGAARFGYVQLPSPRCLLRNGVVPRLLTNFPDYITQEYLKRAEYPFSQVIRALMMEHPVFFSDCKRSEEVYFNQLCRQSGFSDGIVFPIQNAQHAAFVYFFDKPVDKSWVSGYLDTPMANIAELVHMAILARPHLCPDFGIPGLTPRIREVMDLKARGYTNESVAESLGVKPDTIKKTIRRFSDRLGGRSTAELIYHLTKLGMI